MQITCTATIANGIIPHAAPFRTALPPSVCAWVRHVAGSRRMLSWIFLVSAASTALFSMNSSYMGFILLYGISGFAQSAAFPLCVKALAPWFSAEHRGMVLGTWTTSQQLGGVISTSVAGYDAYRTTCPNPSFLFRFSFKKKKQTLSEWERKTRGRCCVLHCCPAHILIM